ncbi:MAG: slipin family protein [Deltaproteobacteria bacterium]|nr:MAG: slipin family protein [Deltaproteobacteria bacterium]
MRVLTVARHERVALVRSGALRRVLEPGRHWVFDPLWLTEAIHYDVRELVQPLTEAEPWLLPGTRLLTVEPHQVATVAVDGLVRRVLEPGRYRLWEAIEGVSIRWHDTREAPAALVDSDRLQPVRGEWTEHVASKVQALILFHDGQPVRTLAPGRYRVWRGSPWAVVAVPLGLSPVELAVQDLVTADRVPVRVRASAAIRVTDALVRAGETRATDHVYGAVQLGLREVVAERTLEQLVSDRDALSDALLARTRVHLPEVGVGVEAAFVKDVILSAEVKDLVGRVTLARMEAEAHGIRRREEVAATRQLANTAKLLEKSPILLRLKELEALGELAQRIDKLVVVGGSDLAQQLLTRRLADELD